MLINSKKKFIGKTTRWPPCFCWWRGNPLWSQWEAETASQSWEDTVVVTFVVVKENSAQVSLLVCICVEILETVWFQISKLFTFHLRRSLFFWGRQPSLAFLSCLFLRPQGWMTQSAYSLSVGREFWTCVKQKPGERAFLPLPSCLDCQDSDCCPLQRIALGGGLFRLS